MINQDPATKLLDQNHGRRRNKKKVETCVVYMLHFSICRDLVCGWTCRSIQLSFSIPQCIAACSHLIALLL